MTYVYHFKSKNMSGSKLFPLNTLRELHPQAAELHLKKYENRPKLLEQRIPPLDCLWNDVIHLAPIHPQIILNLWRELDLPIPASLHQEVIKIPSRMLVENKTVTITPRGRDPHKEFFAFAHDHYQEQTTVSQAQIEDWRDQAATGWPLFWYSSTMHILTKDEIDIADFEIDLLK